MSLTTLEAINCAIDDIENAMRCLIDTVEPFCGYEIEALELIDRQLREKLGKAETKRRKEEE